MTEDSLVYRYARYTDGIAGSEGAFAPCSFWFIECLARSGQVERAHLLFEKMAGYSNHPGLYSEELASSGEFLPNFPQTLTHLAFISAATLLDRKLSKKEDVWP